jgi:Inner membrane component of T3SS, cytoplasmic domain
LDLGPRVNPRDSTRALAGAIMATDHLASGARLVVLGGPSAGLELPLRDGAVLGRARRAELRIDDPLASRRHVRFTCRAGQWTVLDLASKNGFTVNGARPKALATLSPGDRLALGATALGFFADGAEPARPVEAPGGAPAGTAPHARAVSSSLRLCAAALLARAAALGLAAAR